MERTPEAPQPTPEAKKESLDKLVEAQRLIDLEEVKAAMDRLALSNIRCSIQFTRTGSGKVTVLSNVDDFLNLGMLRFATMAAEGRLMGTLK